MDLNNKIAVITGASSGIGYTFSKALINKGSTVYGVARSTEKLNKIQEELGQKFVPVSLDITVQKDVEKWSGDIFSDTHQPDILINNAGLGRFGKVDELPVEDWHSMIDTNLSGTFYMTRQIVPLMKRNTSTCHIVNIASIAGKIGNPELSGYNASKYAVRGFSEALFKELRYDGIKVTCFYPGSIATSFFDKATRTGTHPNMMKPEDVATVLVNLLETPDNFLVSDITMRPLNPKPPEDG